MRYLAAIVLAATLAGCANSVDQLNRRDAQHLAAFQAEAGPTLAGIDAGNIDMVSGTATLADIAARTMPEDPAYEAAWRRASRIAQSAKDGMINQTEAERQISQTIQAYQDYKDREYQSARQRDVATQDFLNAMAVGVSQGAANYTYQQGQMYHGYRSAPTTVPQPVICTTRAPGYPGGGYQTTCN